MSSKNLVASTFPPPPQDTFILHALCAGVESASQTGAAGVRCLGKNKFSDMGPASKPARRHSLPRALLLCVCVHAGAPTGTRRLLAASPLHHREGGCQELEGFAPAKGGCQKLCPWQRHAKSFAAAKRTLRLPRGSWVPRGRLTAKELLCPPRLRT